METKQFIRKYQPIKYNLIKPIKYPDSERSFLKDELCKSNMIGKDNDIILRMFCYDAKWP